MNIFSRTFFLLFLATLFFVTPQVSLAATLDVSPLHAAVASGQVVHVAVTVSSPSASINAVSGTLTFPTDLLSVYSISKSSSVLTLWIQNPSYSNSGGTVNFSGVAPNPGYSGMGGNVITITFVAKKQGTATLTFSDGAQVLANDGNGTNVLTSANPGSVTVGPPVQVAPPASTTPSIVVSSTSAPAPVIATTTPVTLTCPPESTVPSNLIFALLLLLLAILLVLLGLMFWYIWRPYRSLHLALEREEHRGATELEKQLEALRNALATHEKNEAILKEGIAKTEEALQKEIQDVHG